MDCRTGYHEMADPGSAGEILRVAKAGSRRLGAGILHVAALVACVILSTCSNPVADKKKGPLIRTLWDSPLQRGRHMFYWDGKDDAKKTVTAGAYLCFMEAENDIESIEMTAVSGSKGKSADSTGNGFHWTIETNPLHYLLEQNFPDPFYVKDGTNISFEIPEPAYVKLTIHSK